MIDVVILCYNHSKWIAKAISSVLSQKDVNLGTIIIADDASTDDSIKTIESVLNNKVKILTREKNLGINLNYFDALNYCQSKYVAFLEGDDYWSDPNKITKQLEILENNPDFIACSHPVQVIDQYGNKINETLPNIDVRNMPIFDPYYTMPIYPPGFHTGSLVVKTDIIRQCYRPEFDTSPAKDMAVHYLLCQMGQIGFIPECLGVYRRLEKSAFNKIEMLNRIAMEVRTHVNLHPMLNGKLAEFHEQILANHTRIWQNFCAHDDYKSELPSMIEWIYATNDQNFIAYFNNNLL